MGRFDETSGLCATCRYLHSRLYPYTAEPWGLDYYCELMASHFAPKATHCLKFEREPGSDDEPLRRAGG